GGSATSFFSILPLVATFTSISPASGGLGTSVDVVITGTNLFSPLTIQAGSGITAVLVSTPPGGTTATARLLISAFTTLGVRSMTVTTPGGTSTPLDFTVTPGPPPTLTALGRTSGAQSTTVGVSITGTNFTTGFTFNPGPDITIVSLTNSSSTSANATLQ